MASLMYLLCQFILQASQNLGKSIMFGMLENKNSNFGGIFQGYGDDPLGQLLDGSDIPKE